MDPHLRAKNFKELMARLAVEPYEFGEIAGLARSQIDRIVDGTSMWNSKFMNRKAAAGIGLDVLEMERFLDDEGLSLKQVADLARPVIASGRDLLKEKKRLKARVNAASLRYERSTGEEMVAGLKEFAAEYLWRMFETGATDEMIRRAVADLQAQMTGIIERGRETRVSAPGSSTPPPRSGPNKASGGSYSRRSRPR